MDDAVFTLFIHCSHHSKSSLIICVYSKQTGKEKTATLPEQQRIFLETFLCGLLPLAWTEIPWIFFGPILGCDWIPGGEETRGEDEVKEGLKGRKERRKNQTVSCHGYERTVATLEGCTHTRTHRHTPTSPDNSE